jgi:hypothetical protein
VARDGDHVVDVDGSDADDHGLGHGHIIRPQQRERTASRR